MLRILFLSLLLGFGPVCGWASDLIGDKPQLSPSADSQTATATAPAPAAKPAASAEALDQAQRLYRTSKFDSAVKKYRQILEQEPSSSDAYAGLTRAYLKMKDVKQASDTVTKGIEAADSPRLRVALGEVYFRQGRFHDAEHEWTGVINSGHRDARAYLGLARLYRAISMYKTAQTMIEAAHKLDPSDPEIQREWVGTLSLTERIRYLEDYLAGETNDDAETRAHLQHQLEYLKARAKDPQGACRLVSKVTTTQASFVPLLSDAQRLELRGFGLTVGVNGKKSALLFDTGATGILINRDLAEKAGVTKLSDTTIGGIGDKGSQSGYMGLAGSLKIGELEFQNCTVTVIDKRSAVGEDGLIGADVFSSFLVDIDFPNRKLRLSELPKRSQDTPKALALKTDKDADFPEEQSANEDAKSTAAKPAAPINAGPQDRYIAPEMKSYTPVFRFGHDLLVSTKIGEAPVKMFLLDTGSVSNFIATNAAGEVTKVSDDPNTTVTGVSGEVKKVYRADKAVIQFGHMRQENEDLIAFDLKPLSDDVGMELSGILGFRVLNLLDIKIDYRDGLVDFSYDPSRWH